MDYPAVALVGARQVGKTTLARGLGGLYYDLEQPGDRTRLDVEWSRVISSQDLVILDEAQSWPEVFPRLRGAIDDDRRRHGRFLILGSVAPALMTQVSESLAGRLSVVELTPFTADETGDGLLDDLWLKGGFPDGSYLYPSRFPQWQDDYLSLLTQRDLPAWGLPSMPHHTARMLAMLAAVNGQTWNATQIGSSLGISRTTVNTYLGYLEGAYLVRRLTPLRTNLRKRLTKSPKLYWRDSGLLHATLGVTAMEELLRQPWVGASWEGFVVNQIVNTLAAHSVKVETSYFRTSDQYEMDLVIARGGDRWAVEIKLTSSPSPDDITRLRKVAEMIQAQRAVLLCRVDEETVGDRVAISPLAPFLRTVVEAWS